MPFLVTSWILINITSPIPISMFHLPICKCVVIKFHSALENECVLKHQATYSPLLLSLYRPFINKANAKPMMSSNSSRGVDLKAWIALSYSPMELRNKTKLIFNIKTNFGLYHRNTKRYLGSFNTLTYFIYHC